MQQLPSLSPNVSMVKLLWYFLLPGLVRDCTIHRRPTITATVFQSLAFLASGHVGQDMCVPVGLENNLLLLVGMVIDHARLCFVFSQSVGWKPLAETINGRGAMIGGCTSSDK